MRLTWSAEKALSIATVISIEAAWLTLAYLLFDWLAGRVDPYLDIVLFAIAVAAGLAQARALRNVGPRAFASALVVGAISASFIGAVLPGLSSPDLGGVITALETRPLVWLLGLAVIRGAARAESGDDLYGTERLLRLGVPGLVVFWLGAATTWMTGDTAFGAPAFAATLTFLTAGLLGLGLSRLYELEVDLVDQRARRRWLAVLITVVGGALLIGVALAPLVGYPVSAAVDGALGPLGPVLVWSLSVVAAVVFGVAQLVVDLFSGLHFGQPSLASTPPITTLAPFQTPFVAQPGRATLAAAPDATWLVLVAALLGAAVLFVVVVAFVRRPTLGGITRDVLEVRSREPIDIRLGGTRPHFRSPFRRHETPSDAIAAYRLALEALVDRAEERHIWETPREHSRRIWDTGLGTTMARLAVDYELAGLGGRPLTIREQRRAIVRWRHVSHLARPSRRYLK